MKRNLILVALVVGIGIIGIGFRAPFFPGGLRMPTQDRTSLDPVEGAYLLRKALGYDTVTMAALNVPDATQFSIARAAIGFVERNSAIVAPLLEEVQRLERMAGLLELDASPDSYLLELRSAHAQLSQGAATLLTQFETLLGTSFTTVASNIRANAGLDSKLRILTLSAQHRDQLLLASLDRNATVRNPYRWHRTGLVANAETQFDTDLSQILTPENLTAYDGYVDQLTVNLLTADNNEQAAIQDYVVGSVSSDGVDQ